VKKRLGGLPFIAEDLGFDHGRRFMRSAISFRYLGPRVLQFAYDGNSTNPYLPHNYSSNTVVYTGTHDQSYKPRMVRGVATGISGKTCGLTSNHRRVIVARSPGI
jgi:4-alpha-glucanotransferase